MHDVERWGFGFGVLLGMTGEPEGRREDTRGVLSPDDQSVRKQQKVSVLIMSHSPDLQATQPSEL